MKILISSKNEVDGLLLDPSNHIADLTKIVGSGESAQHYKKYGKVFWDKIKSGEEALSIDTDDDSWVEVKMPDPNAQASNQPLTGIVEPAV